MFGSIKIPLYLTNTFLLSSICIKTSFTLVCCYNATHYVPTRLNLTQKEDVRGWQEEKRGETSEGT